MLQLMMEGGAVELLEISEAWLDCVCNVLSDIVLEEDVTDVVMEIVNVVVEVPVETDETE